MCVDNLPDFPMQKPKEEKRKDAERTFWDLLDIKATIYHRLAPHIKQYNDSLPSCKGKIRSGESSVAKVLLHLMALEMERMRKDAPRDYAYYLSSEIDCFPVSTNRGQLCTLLDNHYCKSTLSSYLIRLQSCDIIKRKINTSRSHEFYTDENGKKQSRVVRLKGGRGNIIYFINKDLLVKRISFEEMQNMSNLEGEIGKFSTIDNQRVIPVQSKKLEHSQNDFQRTTLKIYSNNSGNCEEDATASPILSSAPAGGQESEGNKKSKPCPPTFKARPIETSGGGRKLSAFFKEAFDYERKGDSLDLPDLNALERRRKYILSIEYEQRFVHRLPAEREEYYVFLLCEQIRNLLYPKISMDTWQQQDVQIRTLLTLHLRRLKNDMKDNYLQLSRAIYMVYKHLQRNEKNYIYGALTWLRLDDKMKSGTLKKVVDEWVPRERIVLQKKFSKDLKFLAWQKITVRSEIMFANMTLTLRQGMLNAIEEVKINGEALRVMCRAHDLSFEKEEQIVQDFQEKCVSVLAGMTEQGMKKRVPSMKELYVPKKRKNANKKYGTKESWEKVLNNLPTIES